MQADPLALLRKNAERAWLHQPVSISGLLTAVSAEAIEVEGLSPHVVLGQWVKIGDGEDAGLGEVLRVEAARTLVKPFEPRAIAVGTRVFATDPIRLAPCEGWKGRVIDAFGKPIDHGGPLPLGPSAIALDRDPPAALERSRVSHPMPTGVRAIDVFVPLCAGQRIGVFAASGIGKSTLLGMLAGAEAFDVVVLALIGERGREVRDFLEDVLGRRRERVITIVATADESAMRRRLALRTATGVAESFRDRGQSVLLIVDSLTRFAQATREVALAAGEAPVARGFPPSVFPEMAGLLERAGPGATGSITAIYSVLVDGDDHDEPIADAARGALDGHVVLSRGIAEQGRFPPIDPLRSLSRLAGKAHGAEQRQLAARLRALISRFEETTDLRLMGAYQPGQDGDLDQAVGVVPRLYRALGQSPADPPSRDAFADLADLLQTRAQR